MQKKLSAQELIRRIESGSSITRSITNNPLYQNAVIYFDENSSEQFIPLDELISYTQVEQIAINEILTDKQKFTDMIAHLKLKPTINRDPIIGTIVGQEYRKGIQDLISYGLLQRNGSGKRKSKKKLKTNKQKFNFKKLKKQISRRLKPRIKTRSKPKKNKPKLNKSKKN